MAKFIVEGNHRLSGSISPKGAKNEALEILCATLLTKEKVIVGNVPDILDVNNLILLLSEMGVKIEKLGDGEYSFQAIDIDTHYLGSDLFKQRCAQLRGSVMLIGPLLARLGHVQYSQPGGDKIGKRRLDTHFRSLMALGANVQYNKGIYEIDGEHLFGNYILMDEASVTGTANVIMVSVLTKGKTTIYNAACDPYIQQLCQMLIKMGAHINGVGSNLLIIEGVTKLHGTHHTLLPDMIEVGSFIGMATITHSELTIKNVGYEHLGIIPSVFQRLGIRLEINGDDLHIPQQEHYCVENYMDGGVISIADAPWPGFTPDLLSVILVVATQAKGSVLIHQKMFESRLYFVDKLIDMGAQIILCDPHRAVVIGLDNQRMLRANAMTSPDIRAGIALLIAAMSADGTSIIDHIDQIDRGYENIDKRLNAIGAKITRTE